MPAAKSADDLCATSTNISNQMKTSRKRKNYLENLKSNLSPKYIGEKRVMENFAAGGRFLRANRNINSQSKQNLIHKEEENSALMLSFAGNTQNTTPTTKFVSPIDKLLLSNGSTIPMNISDTQKPDVRWFLEDINSNNVLQSTLMKDTTETNVLQIDCNQNNEPAQKLDDSVAKPQNVLSPAASSLDSAKGSSMVNSDSIIEPPYIVGEICWGQIYTFCYWPCIVCPDPEGKSISTVGGRNRERHIVVNVRFFADHGRRSWVKCDHLIPFNGRKAYDEYTKAVLAKFGANSQKYKLLFPTRHKKELWENAITEATSVLNKPTEERIKIFEEIQQKTKMQQKIGRRMRKKSDTYDDGEQKQEQEDNMKRKRSESPTSPAFSPIKSDASKIKRVRSQSPMEVATNATKIVANSDADEVYNTKEYKKFYAILHSFVMDNHYNESLEKSLAKAVRNIWSLKKISQAQQQEKLLASLDTAPELGSSVVDQTNNNMTNKTLKRLSNRLKYLTLPRTLFSPIPNGIAIASIKNSISEDSSLATSTPKEKKPSGKKKKRPVEDIVESILRLDHKYLFKGMTREHVCKYCLNTSSDLVQCKGRCQQHLHSACLAAANNKTLATMQIKPGKQTISMMIMHKTADSILEEEIVEQQINIEREELICNECKKNNEPTCYVCEKPQANESEPLICCNIAQCMRYMHEKCSKYWPQAKFVKTKQTVEHFRCPTHVCHTCVSDDPKGTYQHLPQSKLTRCLKCPATYHTDSRCIPAGSQILSAAYMICPRHQTARGDQHVNVSWCFICVRGGHVVCCETCPIAVHAACLKIPLAADEGYICEECESGRLPLYGELVWTKYNTYRWWPALILPPTEIPINMKGLAHNSNDFVVHFFGTHDHGWISRRRVYLFVEGDCGEPQSHRKVNSSLDKTYMQGVEEAKHTYDLINKRKLAMRLENGFAGGGVEKSKLRPQPYVKIKTNRPVAPFKLRNLDAEGESKCECNPDDVEPCGMDSDCLNRMLYHECNPKVCAAGKRCQNQMFESRISPRLDVVYMKERGFGLVCREPIPAGTFVIEYVGELINIAEFTERLAQKIQDRDENFYFLSLEKDHIIDAGPKGNLARFMNHSCDPNCETQKWVVNGNNRVGIFAIKDIPENTELTFNYLWDDLLSNEKKPCHCGADNCTGLIGGKPKEEKSKNTNVVELNKTNLSTKSTAKRRREAKVRLDDVTKQQTNKKNNSNSIKDLEKSAIAISNKLQSE